MNAVVAGAVRLAREPVAVDPVAIARVLAAVHLQPPASIAQRSSPRTDVQRAHAARSPEKQHRWRDAMRRPLLSPALAAAIALAAFGVGLLVADGVSSRAPVAGVTPVTFVLVAHDARDVSIVGDFNDWDPDRTPLDERDGVWSIVVPLPPGRYSYAFLVDGERWVADPSAPPSAGEDFGRPGSVVLVERGRT